MGDLVQIVKKDLKTTTKKQPKKRQRIQVAQPIFKLAQ